MIDEIFNVSISNQISQGARPFVDCWDLYQTGDMFSAPFLALFKALTGSTDGIVLVSRYVFFGFNIVTLFLIYFAFKNYIGKKPAFLAGLFMLLFAPLSVYNLWYDTAGVNFMLDGLALLVIGMNAANNKKKNAAFICAGIFHSFMSISYPYFVIAALLLFCCTVIYALIADKSPRMPLCYAAGASVIIVIALIYVLIVGKKNIFLFNPEIMNYITTRTLVKDVGAAGANAVFADSAAQGAQQAAAKTYISGVMQNIIIPYVKCVKQDVIIPYMPYVGIPLALYTANRFFKNYFLYFLTFAAAVLSVYLRLSDALNNYAEMTFVFLMALWSILFFWDLPPHKRKAAFMPMALFLVAAAAGFCGVCMTLAGIERKPVFAVYPLALMTMTLIAGTLMSRPMFPNRKKSSDIIETADAVDENASVSDEEPGESEKPADALNADNNKENDADKGFRSVICDFISAHEKTFRCILTCAVIFLAAAESVSIFCQTVYPTGIMNWDNYVVREKEGIYKGLLITQAEHDQVHLYKDALDKAITEDDKTILVLNPQRMPGYLISDLKPASHSLWSVYVAGDTYALKLYFENVSGEPDIIVSSGSDKDFMGDMKESVTQKYYEASKNACVTVYRKKDDYR